MIGFKRFCETASIHESFEWPLSPPPQSRIAMIGSVHELLKRW